MVAGAGCTPRPASRRPARRRAGHRLAGPGPRAQRGLRRRGTSRV